MNEHNFLKVSVVDASFVKSKWQAHFMQLFPIKMDELPETHESDKAFFEKHWRGDKHTTYKQFIADNS